MSKIQQKMWFQNIGFKVVKVMFRGRVGSVNLKILLFCPSFYHFSQFNAYWWSTFSEIGHFPFFSSARVCFQLWRGASPSLSYLLEQLTQVRFSQVFFWYRDSQVLFQVCVIYIVYPCFIDRLTTWVESFQCSLVFTDWAPISYPRRANHCHILRCQHQKHHCEHYHHYYYYYCHCEHY